MMSWGLIRGCMLAKRVAPGVPAAAAPGTDSNRMSVFTPAGPAGVCAGIGCQEITVTEQTYCFCQE